MTPRAKGPEYACHQCGYALDGIVTTGPVRCPECAIEYDTPPKAIVPLANSWRALVHTAGPCVLIVAAALTLSQFRVTRNYLLWPFSLVWLFLLFWTSCFVPWQAAGRLAQRHEVVTRRRAFRWRVAGVGWFITLIALVVGHRAFKFG